MSKKTNKPGSDNSIKMNRYYLVGNFFLARKSAKNILTNPVDEREVADAKAVLKKTWPDTQALLAGLGCLVFSLLAAFIAA